MRKYPCLTLSCAVLLLSLLLAAPCLAECNMTSASLDAALAKCDGGNLDCYVGVAVAYPGCSGNIAWYYMILYAPDDPEVVVNRFTYQLPFEYGDELAFVITEAHRVNQREQKAGDRTSANEYPYGQGAPYGQ